MFPREGFLGGRGGADTVLDFGGDSRLISGGDLFTSNFVGVAACPFPFILLDRGGDGPSSTTQSLRSTKDTFLFKVVDEGELLRGVIGCSFDAAGDGGDSRKSLRRGGDLRLGIGRGDEFE